MSKNKSDGFNNKAARKFRQPDKIDLMSQQEIFELLDEDISTVLGQVTSSRNHEGKYPTYFSAGFANLSTALWFNKYVKEHIKVTKKCRIKSDLSDDDIESIRTLLSEAYKKSATNQFPNQTQELVDRNKLISETFIMLCPEVYKLTKKLHLDKDSQRRDLTIQIYGDPVMNMRYIHKIFNHSVMDDKKKVKLLKEMYGKKRFIAAVGAAMTVDSNNSDFLVSLYEYMMDKKLKERAPYILAYAQAYKKNKSSNYRLQSGEFYKKNKKLIKELKKGDIGFKKAFKNLKPKKGTKDIRSSKDKKDSWEIKKF